MATCFAPVLIPVLIQKNIWCKPEYKANHISGMTKSGEKVSFNNNESVIYSVLSQQKQAKPILSRNSTHKI
jgi:hypothetical protein